MFRLESPPVVITQQEHARLAGRLAAEWGNADFARPNLDEESFSAGVTLHDWHYGMLDDFPLDDWENHTHAPDRMENWLAIARRGLTLELADPVADLVSKRHLLRLVSNDIDERSRALADQIRGQIRNRMKQTSVAESVIEFADRITGFCDKVSFHVFRSGTPRFEVDVLASAADDRQTTLECKVITASRVTVDPWPFRVEAIQHDVIAYSRDLYPQELEPHLMRIVVSPALERRFDS